MAWVSSSSCGASRKPIWSPIERIGTVTMLSQLTTPSALRPFGGPTGTSVERPRTVEAHCGKASKGGHRGLLHAGMTRRV